MNDSEITPEKIEQVSARAICLLTTDEVESVLDDLANQITARLRNENPILVSVMNGAVITVGKLATRLNFPLKMDYLHATRYRDKTNGSELEWKHYPESDLREQVVLVVDDILDEGDTLAAIKEYILAQSAKAVYIAVLVNKLHDRKVQGLSADFVGVEIEDKYLYGYGMDYKGYLRNAPGIYAVDSDDCG